MAIVVESRGDAAVVRVVGPLAAGNRMEFRQQVMDAVARGASHVVVDLAQAGYVDSTGLGTLVLLAKRVRAQGGALRLENLNEDVRTLFALTKLDSVLDLGPATPTAV
jgi:anti-sigma B factor antagonist